MQDAAGVEQAAASESLLDTPVDLLLDRLDGPIPSYRNLYYRWETEQWEAGAIDLFDDRRQWADLGPGVRTEYLRGLSPFTASRGSVATALVPFVDAAPDEEQQVFLTTQLADHARHLVFVDRYRTDVVDEPDDASSRAGGNEQRLEPALGGLLDALAETSGRIGGEPGDHTALVEGVVFYHLVFEGMVVLSTQRFLLDRARHEGHLPGFRHGATAVVRDLVRHIGFATAFLHEMVVADARNGQVIRSALPRFVPLALDALGSVQGTEETGTIRAQERTDYAQAWLKERLDQIGVGSQD